MSNPPTPITDDEIRSILYRMAAHVSFFAEPRTPDPKAGAFADALMSAVRPTDPEPPVVATPPGERRIEFVIAALKKMYAEDLRYIPEDWTVSQIFENAA